MATEERLPHACAFAISVLAEYEQDPEAVPEEAVEAAQQHMATCVRCLSTMAGSGTPRKKKKPRRVAGFPPLSQEDPETPLEETPSPPGISAPERVSTEPARTELVPRLTMTTATASATATLLVPIPEQATALAAPADMATAQASAAAQAQQSAQEAALQASIENQPLDCLQCRQLLPEYAEAMDSGQNVAMLYPEVQAHLLACETGCLVLLDLFRQEAKANRKYRRRPVRDPFSAIWWELTGFFRAGQIPMGTMALSYGTLILLLLVASLSAFLGIRWDDARYYVPPPHTIPTPDGVGLSDGLKVYDACNANSYHFKREAAQAIQNGALAKADSLLTSATNVTLTDTTGCNGAEAAIYREDLHVRQAGRPFSMVVVSFDSGPGNADPRGGTNRHILYAAYTQELVGAYISQQQYNTTQLQTPGAPLLYLVLANTTGVEQGAVQIANQISDLVHATDLQQFGLLVKDSHPLLAVLGLGPSSLLQTVLPHLCRAGIPLIAPTATGLFIVDMLQRTSLYRNCAPGFAFIRFSPDDARQSQLAASYAYNQLHVQKAAIFYDPSNPSSQGSAQAFSDYFLQHPHARIVAQEEAVASGLLDANGMPQAPHEDITAGLNDILKASSRADLIFAPLLTNDVITLAQAIMRLPTNEQPILMIGGEFVQPAALQGLVLWARQQQLTLPRIFVSISSAVRPPSGGQWPKQFYASFCTSFATPGSFCSGAAALDQGALFFADGIQIITRGIGPITDITRLPSRSALVQHISTEQFAGVSCQIALRLRYNVLVTSTTVLPVVLGIQDDGSIQIVN